MKNRYAYVGLLSFVLLVTGAFARRSDGFLQVGLWILAVVEVATIWVLLARRN